MKKLFCLFVGLLMLTLSLCSCGGGLTDQSVASDPQAQTLVMALIKSEKTTDEAIKRVEEAINDITQSEFNTKIVLKMFTPDEYVSKITEMSQKLWAKQEAYEESIKDKYGRPSVPESEKNKDVRTYDVDVTLPMYYKIANGDYQYNDESNYGKPTTVYPAVKEDQLDILFVDSMETYYKLVDQKYIINLLPDYEENRDISKYVNATMLSEIQKVGNALDEKNCFYAVPNNYVIPEYRYFLVNKKLYDYYQYDISCSFSSAVTAVGLPAGSSQRCDDLLDFVDFLNDVAENNEAEKAKGSDLAVDTILYNYMDIRCLSYFNGGKVTSDLVPYGNYASYNIGDRWEMKTTIPRPLTQLLNSAYMTKSQQFLEKLRTTYGESYYKGRCFYKGSAEENGYAAPAANMEDNEKTFALAMVSGDSNIEKYYSSDDYYIVQIDEPILDNTMYDSMFAISTFSSTSLDSTSETGDENSVKKLSMRTNIYSYDNIENPRCFEIITALQSNENLVNLLTYGVQGVDYDRYDNDEVIHNVGKNGYDPIVGKAGNLFLTYPNDQMNSEQSYYAADSWEAAKLQNLDTAVSYYLGFRMSDEIMEGTDLSSKDADAQLTAFCAEYMPKLLNFSGVDDEGNEITYEEYKSRILSQLRALPAYAAHTGGQPNPPTDEAEIERCKYTPYTLFENFVAFLVGA